MAPFIVTVLVLTLTTNLFPLFNVIGILSLFPLQLFCVKAGTPDRYLGPRTAVHFVTAAYIYWILSYLLTTAPPAHLISYDFLRLDGALLVGYLPLLLLGDVGLRPGLVYRLIWVYLGILAAAGVLGCMLLLLVSLGHLPQTVPLLTSGEDHEMATMLVGLYRTHMTTGNLYAMAALLALSFILRRKTPKLVSWGCLVFVILFAALILSGARTAYVAFAATFVFQFARKKAYLMPLLKIGTLVLVPTTLFFLSQPAVFSRVASIVYFQGHRNVEVRFGLYEEALTAFSNSPLIGIGFGRFEDSGKTYFGLRHFVYVATSGEQVGDVLDANQAHDSYLQFLAEGGLVGLFLMLGIWVATYRWAGRLRERVQDGTIAAALCEGVQACVLVTLFSSLTGTTMAMATTPLFVFTMVGLLRNVVACECRPRVAKSASGHTRRKLSLGPLGHGPLSLEDGVC